MNIELLNSNSESLEKLLKEVFGKEVEKINIEEFLNKDIRFLCAFINNEVVGNIMITTNYNPVRNTKEFYLDYVCVKEEYSNQGIASKLLDYVYDLAKKEKVEVITLETSFPRVAAQHLYEKNGFIKKEAYIYNKKVGE